MCSSKYVQKSLLSGHKPVIKPGYDKLVNRNRSGTGASVKLAGCKGKKNDKGEAVIANHNKTRKNRTMFIFHGIYFSSNTAYNSTQMYLILRVGIGTIISNTITSFLTIVTVINVRYLAKDSLNYISFTITFQSCRLEGGCGKLFFLYRVFVSINLKAL